MEQRLYADKPAPALSVVLSFYNEEEVLPELIQRLRAVLTAEKTQGRISGYELVFVNDASTDGSEEALLKEAGAGCDGYHAPAGGHHAPVGGHHALGDIKIVTMSRNFGVSPCVLAGMEHSSGDLVVYMDSDLQDPPELIPSMLKALREGDNIDVVNTVRLSRNGEPHSKLLITKIGYKMLKYVTNINFLVEAGDFKLLTRRAVEHLIRLKEKMPFMRGLVYWIGFNQAVVHYHREPRRGGKAKFPLTDPRVIHNFLFSALISFSDMPLRLALFFGAVTMFFSFAMLTYVLVQKFVLAYTPPGWTALMAVVLGMGGMQLLTIGIIGLYINAIFLDTKGRPNYIVSRTFGFNGQTP